MNFFDTGLWLSLGLCEHRILLCDHSLSFAFQFLIHCEGTRFTEKKHQISMQVAQAKGLPSLKHHLLPRTKGFAITVKCLRDVGKDAG